MTLVELLVVMAIIGLIVGISLPALTSYTKQVRLKTATRQVMSLVSLARSVAISSHQGHAVVFDADHQAFQIVNVVSGEALEHVVHLPASMKVEVEMGGQPAPQAQLVFRATGSLTGRTSSIILEDNHKQRTITVTGPTGAISLQ